MLLALDIGNTTVGIGLFETRTLVKEWTVQTDPSKTSDEYGIILLSLLEQAGLEAARVQAAILSSVVPPLTPVFQNLIQSLFHVRAITVGPGLRTGMPILYENPLEVGADRIVAAVAALEKYGGPCIVVDFGTATTFDAVSAKGEYLGGSIAPGIQISAEALYLKTARLPRIEVKKPGRVIGRTTVTSMQSGLHFGYVGLVSNIIAEMKKELSQEAKVISTGGFAAEITPEVAAIDVYEPHLVMEGLRIIYERNQN
jgi:type III pantothenate kinase